MRDDAAHISARKSKRRCAKKWCETRGCGPAGSSSDAPAAAEDDDGDARAELAEMLLADCVSISIPVSSDRPLLLSPLPLPGAVRSRPGQRTLRLVAGLRVSWFARARGRLEERRCCGAPLSSKKQHVRVCVALWPLSFLVRDARERSDPRVVTRPNTSELFVSNLGNELKQRAAHRKGVEGLGPQIIDQRATCRIID